MAHVRDGAPYTYLVGEKYIDPLRYENASDHGNDQGWDIGYDHDVLRWTCYDGVTPSHAPSQDRPQHYTPKIFGSAHSGTFNMAFCDGSVRAVSYSINPETHRRLGNRKDELPIDESQL